MDSAEFISTQPAEWQGIMSAIHSLILQEDSSVTPVIEPMMGKEMIIYKGRGTMKYALSGGKKHMSLHVLPLYVSSELYAKYQPLFTKAAVQKGCINFANAEEMPMNLTKDLISEAAGIDPVRIREEQMAEKKLKSKAAKK